MTVREEIKKKLKDSIKKNIDTSHWQTQFDNKVTAPEAYFVGASIARETIAERLDCIRLKGMQEIDASAGYVKLNGLIKELLNEIKSTE